LATADPGPGRGKKGPIALCRATRGQQVYRLAATANTGRLEDRVLGARKRLRYDGSLSSKPTERGSLVRFPIHPPRV
jgi:hypothetical protein